MEVTTARPPAGVELGPVDTTVRLVDSEEYEIEVWAELEAECPKCEKEFDVSGFASVTVAHGRMDAILEGLRRKGIDLGRPFVIHIDEVGGMVHAQQDPWRGE